MYEQQTQLDIGNAAGAHADGYAIGGTCSAAGAHQLERQGN